MKRPTILAAGFGALAIACAATATTAAFAATTTHPAGGEIQVFETPPLTGTTGTVLVTGALGDHGEAVKVDKSGTPDLNGTYSKLELSRGTILVNGTRLSDRIASGSGTARLNPASCSIEGSVTEPVEIVSGTGSYANITGTVEVKFTLAELAPTYSSGPKKGQCNPSNGPDAAWASVTGSGTVSFK